MEENSEKRDDEKDLVERKVGDAVRLVYDIKYYFSSYLQFNIKFNFINYSHNKK